MDAAALLSSHLTVGIAVSHLIQWLKFQKWFPFIDPRNRAWVNRAIVALVALATSLGIHWTADWTTGTVTITGLTVAGLAGHGWDWFQQFVLLHGYFTVALEPKQNGAGPIR